MSDDRLLHNRHVAVLGLGIEGRDLCRFVSGLGARVTVFDTRTSAQVGAAAAEAESCGAAVRLGPIEPDEAAAFDALYVSQSVLLHRDPFVQRMRELGRPVSSMMREFLQRWPGPTLGVTGSSGKTTTTSLIASAFVAAGIPHIIGGNIGAGLHGQLHRAAPQTWAILEVSHTQLQLTDRSPHIALVTNVTPNHLDQFSWEEYVDLKRNLVRYQYPEDTVILNAADPIGALLRQDTAARSAWFNADTSQEPGCFRDGNRLVWRADGTEHAFMDAGEVPLRGAHNVENVLAAAAVCFAAGIPEAAFVSAIRGFHPVPHRLEPVATVSGVQYVNDSIATAPERTLAGLRSFTEPVVLLLGGRDKHLPLDELMREAHGRCRAIVCFGEAGRLLEDAARRWAPDDGGAAVVGTTTIEAAVAAAAAWALPGDVVLLAPACTSFDAYASFERRGEAFRGLVCALQAAQEGTPSRA
ncbi:MAG: UDP-N-acetylmuramoyl-L-alanine--D-glutamate ligase [Dehalococcoidia bacterium]